MKTEMTESCFTVGHGVTVDNCGTVESRQPSGLGPSIESMKQNEVVGPQPDSGASLQQVGDTELLEGLVALRPCRLAALRPEQNPVWSPYLPVTGAPMRRTGLVTVVF